MPADQGELFGGQGALPSGLAYQPEFISPEEERDLLEGIGGLALAEARYKEYTAHRRVASFGAGYDFGQNELTPAPSIAAFLLPLRDKLARWAGVTPEAFGYALVAEYRPGTQLGWHRDVPQFGLVAGVSLKSAARMRLRPFPPRRGDPTYDLPLAPRSAYILRDAARWNWQHAIAPTLSLRFSITFRTLA